MNLGGGLESEELRVRQSILYTVGRICDEEGLIYSQLLSSSRAHETVPAAAQKQQHEHHVRARPPMSKEAMALLADLVYKQSEVMATELQFFARHANRKIIKTEDVTLLARKQPNLTNLLQKFQRENLNSSSAASGKKRRRNFADSD
ncbi:hypothetical protein PPTG_02230 [Phytophthora nicotianae INRA-310]|uniref:Centromere protein S n=1 Tax=Phytophthora nicotianae (strain INRA-310) TaxID=761204 RepID=W2R9Z0_PHYN3|nr:hypothetical protein PPTG_02230 [Phytophthora nicotianae INRA-310]ETN22233.1 hypothetical protein PPTG_02230 [Phytophthora nicotianae INRA-310]